MNMVKQSYYLIILVAALASSSWYYTSSMPKFKLDAQTLLTTTDTFVHNVHVYQYDDKGELIHSLQAPLMRHIPKDNTHWIKMPHIVIKQPNKPAWDITANQATALYGGEKITFSQDVVMHQNQDEEHVESTFITEEITYFPKQKRAVSSKKVLFKQPGNQVESYGMRANLETKHIQLLSGARGVYDPKKQG